MWYSLTAFKARQAGITTGKGVRIAATGKYRIVKNAQVKLSQAVLLSHHHLIEAEENSEIYIGSRVHFADGARLTAFAGARIWIEDDCFFNHNVSITAMTEIVIGRDSIFGPYCCLYDHNHGTAPGLLIKDQGYDTGPLYVGSGVWCGIGATLLKGTRIEDGAVVAARAVVNKLIPSNEIVGGIPAKRIGQRAGAKQN